MVLRTALIARLAAFAACLAAGTPVLAGPIAARKGLTLDGAKLVAAAASAEARRLGAGGAIAVVDGAVVGATGVSGAASAQQDDDIAAVAATAAAGALPPPAGDPVTYIGGEKTRAAFAAGMPLTETPAYTVHASRRDAPGLAEVHDRDTDILYVLEGAATLVTGGTVTGEKQTAADERRGDAIVGGKTRSLAKGDLVVVPNGTPHQFTAITAPLLYYVVKVTAGGSR